MAFKGNFAERNFMDQIISFQKKTVDDVFQEIVDDIRSKKITFNNVFTGITVEADSICCHRCAKHVFKSLLYDYRKNIPKQSINLIFLKKIIIKLFSLIYLLLKRI